MFTSVEVILVSALTVLSACLVLFWLAAGSKSGKKS